MSYRRSQRSDRDGSFPEPPCGMGESVSSWGSSRRKNNRLRRSFQALKCFSLWSKHGKAGARDKQATDCAFPGLDVEDSWESGAEVAEEDFEVRTTSPSHSVDGVFDVSQALQAVPEAIEEEDEEESESPEMEIENQEDDAASQGSKPSDYSSEFMTDDSTETSGLPRDSSFSQHGSMESPEVVESRIGIRPFTLPPDLGRSMMAENPAVESDTAKQAHIHPGSPKKETGKGGEAVAAQPSNENPDWSMKEAGKRDEENEAYISSSTTFDSETSAGKPGEEETGIQRVRAELSDSDDDDMQEVFRVLESARSMAKSLEPSISLSPGVEGSRVKPRREFFAVKSPEPSKKWNRNLATSPTRKPGNRVQELMKKFGESPERQKVMTPHVRQPLQAPESPTSATSSSLFQREDSLDVPLEIIRHDVYHATENKGFFWRSHPSISKSSSKGEHSETDLVDTSVSNSEGNRSLDYSEFFSPEELQREYSAPGEPSFIHI